MVNNLSKFVLLNGGANSKACLLLIIPCFPLNLKSTLNVLVPVHEVLFRECKQHVDSTALFVCLFCYTHILLEVLYDPFVPR